jgi:hypothetical protein
MVKTCQLRAMPGLKQVNVSNSSLKTVEGTELTLPAGAPAGLENKATQ